MKPKSSSYARRSLTFHQLPYAGKTFYIDVKSATAKSKIKQRILCLGGQIENFLSKDLSLLITDKTATPHAKDGSSQKCAVKSVPLSRGQALLLKASAQQSCDTNNSIHHGLLQSAEKLGIQIETPTVFLRQSSKLVEKIKPAKPASKQEDCLSGLSTISWDSEKESCSVIKIEDEDGLYRPLFKQFDTFPQISYNETGCPFDVGVVLTKTKECNQSKKKSVGGALRGGYCESCDHWYKCTLREHLNSDKHKEFVSVTENFTSLNQVSSNLPSLRKFVGKYGLKSICSSPDLLSNMSKAKHVNTKSESNNNRPFATFDKDTTEAHKTSSNFENKNEEEQEKQRHISKTEPLSKSKQDGDCLNHNPVTLPVRITDSVGVCQSTDGLHTKPPLNADSSESCNSKSNSTRPKSSLSNKMCRKFSIDDVIRSVTDAEEYFPSGCNDAGDDIMSRSSLVVTKHVNSDSFTNVSSNLSNSLNINMKTGFSGKEKTPNEPSAIDSDKENAVGFRNLPAVCFSSSSCSFGDNGIGNVISFLNSQQSRESRDQECLADVLLGTDSVVNETSKSGSSFAMDSLAEFKGNCGSVTECNATELTNLENKIWNKENDLPVLEAADDTEQNRHEHDVMPVLESYDSEDINKFCMSVMFDGKAGKSNVLTSVDLPEYSNITDEFVPDNPVVESKQNVKTNIEMPVLDFSSNIFKGISGVETPDKSNMNVLKSKIYENQANSGSTIRNWLLPNDDCGSVRSVQSPGNLNATLVNTSCNIEEELQVKCSKEDAVLQEKGACLSNIKETDDSSKVADWIKRQDFVFTADICDNSRQGFQENMVDEMDTSISKGIQANYETESNYFKDLVSCSEKKSGCENENLDGVSNVWSDSGTSISDCTLDNFRLGDRQESGPSNIVSKEAQKDIDFEVLNHDETSQDSGISAKTGLTSVVTGKGIKITGLASFSSHLVSATESDQFTGSGNVGGDSDRKNVACSVASNVNQGFLDSDLKQSQIHLEQNPCYSNHNLSNDLEMWQKCNLQNSSHPSLSMNTGIVTKSNTLETGFQHKTEPRVTKTNTCAKNKSQTKSKKPRNTKNAKSKKQTQPRNLLTQVLSSSVYSPVSPGFGQNDTADQESSRTSQTIPYCSSQEQHDGHTGSHQPLGFEQFHQHQYGGIAHNYGGAGMNSPAFSNTGGCGMMDLLLSPGQQESTFLSQTGFQQSIAYQQQWGSHFSQSNYISGNGPFMSSVPSQQNVSHHFGVMPFTEPYQNHMSSQDYTDSSHHFLSQNSNFLIHNRHSGTSALQQNQRVCQAQVNHVNQQVSQGCSSNNSKNSKENLQTIDLSHIADNSNGCETNFSFKIADTNKLKKANTVKRKQGQHKVLKENAAIVTADSQKNVYNNSSKNTFSTEQFNSKTVAGTFHSGSQMPNNPYSNGSTNRQYENASPFYSALPASHLHQNSHLSFPQHEAQVNFNRAQNTDGRSQNYGEPTCYGQTDQHQNIYNTVQTGDTKLKFRKMPPSNLAPSCKQPKHDLMQYWNVRKAGDCRLVFSANISKRKAEEETPSKIGYLSNLNETGNSQPMTKRRKCLVY